MAEKVGDAVVADERLKTVTVPQLCLGKIMDKTIDTREQKGIINNGT